MTCPNCGNHDFEIIANSNVHSSWITGRTITTNRGEYCICKGCGNKFPLSSLREKTQKELDNRVNEIALWSVAGVFAIIGFIIIIISKLAN